MSLRDEYLNAADWVAGYAYRDLSIPPQASATLAQVLLDLAERVRLLEAAVLKPEHTDAD